MLYFDIQFTLIFINFILLIFLFFYSIYLYSVEKKVKSKYRELTTQTENIVEEANRKAIDILKKSEFISSSLKTEIETNFENILQHIKDQNLDFYSKLKTTYESNTNKMVDQLTTGAQQELEEISKKSEEVQDVLNNKIEAEIAESEQKLEEERKAVITKFEEELKQNVNSKFKEVVKFALPESTQEKIIKEVISRALKDVKNHG